VADRTTERLIVRIKRVLPQLDHLATHGDEFCDGQWPECWKLDVAADLRKAIREARRP
jgi:hypothetical protein